MGSNKRPHVTDTTGGPAERASQPQPLPAPQPSEDRASHLQTTFQTTGSIRLDIYKRNWVKIASESAVKSRHLEGFHVIQLTTQSPTAMKLTRFRRAINLMSAATG